MDESALFRDYLIRSEKVLSFYHPQWDLTNDEISNSPALLKRDGTPICIPPSWDLIGKYAGPEDETPVVFDENKFEHKKRPFTGDRSEAEFLDVLRNAEVGGVLIGDIDSRDLLDANFSTKDDIFSQPRKVRYYLKDLVVTFQLDFLYFNQNGIFHVETKTSRKEKSDDEILERNRAILKDIFRIFCELFGEKCTDNLWEKYFRYSSIFYSETRQENNFSLQKIFGKKSTTADSGTTKIRGKEELKQFLLQANNIFPTRNLFKDRVYRSFLLFLAGSRPAFFISPVRCALILHENIFVNQVNIENFYKKGEKEDKIQIVAKTASEFLKSLKVVKNTEIDFGQYGNIYLTRKQQEAVGYFDYWGNFSPKRQLTFGPPGSGKSLISMLKIFILAQIEKRKEKKLYYWSWREHREILSAFVARNYSKFCRQVKELDIGQWKNVASESADVILDEEDYGSRAFESLFAQGDDRIFSVVCTKSRGTSTAKNGKDDACEHIDVKKFESNGFTVIELRTMFRSTRQIQNFFNKYNLDKNDGALTSGHNFDGVKVEEYFFTEVEKLKVALEERIRRLLEIEGCEERKIGLYHPKGSRKPWLINNVFTDSHHLRSLEFAVMIVVEGQDDDIYLALSRAICHLIVFSTRK